MTAPTKATPTAVPVPAGKDVASARKRRRRAAAGGAADDCFTCTKRNVKCDRRRPYCGQCLEMGNDCSGFKTQLTWGVGVASRGKLRGLSLPIAKAPPVNPGPGKTATSTLKSPPRPRTESTLSIITSTSTPKTAVTVTSLSVLSANGNGGALSSSPSSSSTSSSANPFPPWIEQQHRYHQQSQYGHKDGALRCDLDVSELCDAPRTQPTPTFTNSHYVLPRSSTAHDLPPMSHSAPDGWTHGSWQSNVHMLPPSEPNKYPDRNLHLAFPGSAGILSSSLASFAEPDYLSPLSHAFPAEDRPISHSPTVMLYDGFPHHESPVPPSPVSSIMMEPRRDSKAYSNGLVHATRHSLPGLHNPHPSQMEYCNPFDSPISHRMGQDDHNLGSYSSSAQSYAPSFWTASMSPPDEPHHPPERQPSEHRISSPWPFLTRSLSQSPPASLRVSSELISRMTFFMDYYKESMCPSMVFIDSPSNPFREHILHLCASSSSLQHAICALAACNLRMKRKLSLGQFTVDLGEKQRVATATLHMLMNGDLRQPEDQSLAEEYQHRNLAIHLLNAQLSDPKKAKHDSVLATILLLCHYRMVESGVAKFKTQFAGVKKILRLRRSHPCPPSRESAWMEMLFTYFDAISASINEREAQLNSSFNRVMPDAPLLPPGSENLVGCDRDLFKTISKLGRLNLLSQHRPVQIDDRDSHMKESPPSLHLPPLRVDSPLGSPLGQNLQTPQSHRMSISTESTLYSPAPTQPLQHPVSPAYLSADDDDDYADILLGTCPPSASYEDKSSMFWREFKEADSALRSWSFDPGRVEPLLPATPHLPTPTQVRDLQYLSEAFRQAALLFLERLASPNVPSSHHNFRIRVSHVIHYATSLAPGSNAEKFLLWPLFVVGSECVNELQQSMLRSKCRDLVAKSGYMNNLAALEVLERLWAGEYGQGKPKMAGDMARRGPFSWTKYIGGPGVEVEWMMF